MVGAMTLAKAGVTIMGTHKIAIPCTTHETKLITVPGTLVSIMSTSFKAFIVTTAMREYSRCTSQRL